MDSHEPARHIYISAPTHYGAEVEFVQSLIGLTHVLRDEGVAHTLEIPSGESLITRARNNAVARFLASPATHLLFIDSDESFSPDDVLKLIAAKKPLVGALIPKKGIDWERVRKAAIAGEQDIEGHGAQYVANPSEPTVRIEGECVPVYAIGSGFMLVERGVIASIIEARPDIAYMTDDVEGERFQRWAVFDCAIEPESRRYLSEDFEFCRRAKACGFQPWLHIGVTGIGHIGKHHYRGNVAAAFVRHS